MSSIDNLRFPFKYRILFCFILLLISALVAVLLFSYKWCSQRANEHIDDRLKQNLLMLKRIHEASASDRTQRYFCLKTEPRFQALVDIQDTETLEFSAKEVREELDCASFAFLTPSGKILAWDGVGENSLREPLFKEVENRPEQLTKLYYIGGNVLEVTLLSMHFHGEIQAYLLGAQIIDSAILHEYSLSIGSVVELKADDEVVVSSSSNEIFSTNLVESVLPLNGALSFVIKFDPEDAVESLLDMFRVLIFVSTACILVGGGISLFMADRFAHPIQYLSKMTQSISDGDLSGYLKEAGSPEFKVLARNFNTMIKSLKSYQEQLVNRAVQLQEQVKEKTKQTNQLNKEISAHKETTNQLRSAIKQAEEASKAKDIFLANMSHELRTPLHGILSFARFGIKKTDAVSEEKLSNYFKKINSCGEGLLFLLNELLDLAKLESGKMAFKFKPVDLNFLIKTVIEEVQSQINEKNQELQFQECDFESIATCDPFRISQVVRNLLSNAIKFSSDNSLIQIEISLKNDAFRLSVLDQGLGIPQQELSTVFDKFIQSSKTATGAGGTGLGLAICREIIAAHKGRIWAENRAEGGAIFSFELPKNHPESLSTDGKITLQGC